MFSSIVSFLDGVVPFLVNVAFVTLLERKILGLMQWRVGPTKVGTGGVLQPFSDAVKLFLKESVILFMYNKSFFFLSPAIALSVSVILWNLVPLQDKLSSGLSGLFLLMILSLGVYPLFFAGWSSNSKFAQLGSMRGVAQTISYEISLALVLFSGFLLGEGLSLKVNLSDLNPTLGIMSPLISLWLIICVAETNRTPFDFAEGESELVSGFNTEYGGGGFALIFMAEYGMILMFSGLSAAFFLKVQSSWSFSSLSVLFSGGWIWLRASFPRYRYDQLLNLAWKSFLPGSLSGVLFYWGSMLYFG